jgi:hypothetical protein
MVVVHCRSPFGSALVRAPRSCTPRPRGATSRSAPAPRTTRRPDAVAARPPHGTGGGRHQAVRPDRSLPRRQGDGFAARPRRLARWRARCPRSADLQVSDAGRDL